MPKKKLVSLNKVKWWEWFIVGFISTIGACLIFFVWFIVTQTQ